MIPEQIMPSRPVIAFVDPCCESGYNLENLETGGLGGTEATVLRVTAALRSRFDVRQYQNGRTERCQPDAGELLPLQDAFARLDATVIVVLNRWKVALKLRKLHPDAPIFLWLHVYPGRHNRKMGVALRAADIAVICVSQTHKRALAEFLKPCDSPVLTFIYNPLADDLRPAEFPRDRNRLLFASSPHKGLKEVFQQFEALRQSISTLTLAVADPGYLKWNVGPFPKGVTFLGPLSHKALLQQMRSALCLFYPQTSFAETFGLVLAEANAVGTPALVHKGLGANDEVLIGTDQKVDGHNQAEIAARIEEWRRAPPTVNANPAFRMAEVASRWATLLLDAIEGSNRDETRHQKVRTA